MAEDYNLASVVTGLSVQQLEQKWEIRLRDELPRLASDQASVFVSAMLDFRDGQDQTTAFLTGNGGENTPAHMQDDLIYWQNFLGG